MKGSGVVQAIKTLLCAAVACLTIASAPSASQQTGWTLETILKQLDTEAGQFHSLKADLERTKVTVVVNDKSTEPGQIFVRRADKMRIELTQPDPRTILRAGDHFYTYNPKIHRVEEYSLGKPKPLVDPVLPLAFATSGTPSH